MKRFLKWSLMLCGYLSDPGSTTVLQEEQPVSIVELAKKTGLQRGSTRKFSNASLPELRRARVSFTTDWKPPQPYVAPEVAARAFGEKPASTRDSREHHRTDDDRNENKAEARKEKRKVKEKSPSRRIARQPVVARTATRPKAGPLLWQRAR